MLDFACADTVRECAKRAVRRCVRVAADHGHARQRCARLGADHVHDSLALAQERKERRSAELGDIAVQRGDLLLADRIADAVVAALPMRRRRVVVCSGHDRTDTPELPACHAQAFECLRTGHFMDQVTVDVEDRSAVFFGMDDVFVPKLVVKRAWHGSGLSWGNNWG